MNMVFLLLQVNCCEKFTPLGKINLSHKLNIDAGTFTWLEHFGNIIFSRDEQLKKHKDPIYIYYFVDMESIHIQDYGSCKSIGH